MCSCDYSQQELIALSQVTYTRFGHSLMRDLINNDIDIHGFMGTTIKGLFKGMPKFDITDNEIVKDYKTVIKDFKSSNPKEFKKLRQMAKALDFGLPGGLGAKTFVIYATNYGVNISVDEAIPLCRLWKDTFPETYEYLENPGPELDSLTIPASVESIEGCALNGAKIKQIILEGTEPLIKGEYTLLMYSMNEGCVLRCTKGSGLWESLKSKNEGDKYLANRCHLEEL